MLSPRDRLGLRLQGVLAHALSPITYYGIAAVMRIRGLRVPDIARVRTEFQARWGRLRGPLLVCANHLTLVDSLVIQWALVPGWRTFVRPDRFFWNLPDKTNIRANLFRRVVGYVGKCVPVVRKGPVEEGRRTLDRVAYLLSRGQCVVVFPEGTRSRSGRLDHANLMYGVGRMIQESPTARVLCVYARGYGQHTFSDYPAAGETFFFRVKEATPVTTSQGLRADRDLAQQVMAHLSEMEQEYFAHAHVDR